MIKDVKLKEWFENTPDKKRNELLKILDVEYAHLKLDNDDDLYVTKHGLPFIDLLIPDNYWLDKDWYNNNSLKLEGTSSVYKVRTKKVNDKHKEFVLKWNRMGQDIPGVEDNNELINASFNSPFEEFSLVMELREALKKSPEKIGTQKPLAIYVPADQIELTRLGRKEYSMKKIVSSHKDIALDKYRSYSMIYEWIKGVDVACAYSKKFLEKEYLELLTMDGEAKLNNNGFTVLDRKPHHIIVRCKNRSELLKDKKGKIIFGMIDYELLERLPERERLIKKIRREEYLKRQKDRFNTLDFYKYHPHLSHVNILNVDYMYGHVESTSGRLWVVGKDPYLFDYFLPERWKHTSKTKISKSNEMYHTITKDNIHIVWKISNVGKNPDIDPFKEDERRMFQYGYNSPFEEFSMAIELNKNGMPSIYPRAIYMKGKDNVDYEKCVDDSRYTFHSNILNPDGSEILTKKHEYIVIWGFWNGPDDKLVNNDKDYYKGIDTLKAYKDGVITESQYFSLLNTAKNQLKILGYEDLNLRGNHILLSIDNKSIIVTDQNGQPELRICNFEFLKRRK
jgi:hypothetical protein